MKQIIDESIKWMKCGTLFIFQSRKKRVSFLESGLKRFKTKWKILLTIVWTKRSNFWFTIPKTLKAVWTVTRIHSINQNSTWPLTMNFPPKGATSVGLLKQKVSLVHFFIASTFFVSLFSRSAWCCCNDNWYITQNELAVASYGLCRFNDASQIHTVRIEQWLLWLQSIHTTKNSVDSGSQSVWYLNFSCVY